LFQGVEMNIAANASTGGSVSGYGTHRFGQTATLIATKDQYYNVITGNYS